MDRDAKAITRLLDVTVENVVDIQLSSGAYRVDQILTKPEDRTGGTDNEPSDLTQPRDQRVGQSDAEEPVIRIIHRSDIQELEREYRESLAVLGNAKKWVR